MNTDSRKGEPDWDIIWKVGSDLPLHQAAAKGKDSDIAFELLIGEAKINELDCHWLTAINWATRSGAGNVIKLLIEFGADADLAAVKVLLENGYSINLSDKERRSPLLQAVRQGDREMVRLLLENGADVNIAPLPWRSGGPGRTPLLRALRNGDEDIALLLLEYGADVHAWDSNSWSALHYAAWQGLSDIARALLDHGADVEFITRHGWTPLGVAILRGHLNLMRLFVARDAYVIALPRGVMSYASVAVRTKNYKVLDEFARLADVLDTDTPDRYGWTPLELAASRGDERMTEILLEEAADPDKPGRRGLNARFWAERNGHWHIVALFDEKERERCDE
ncbi:MAG: ankyrin repeat domain-containing protein [Fibrobacteria bacterium]|nr:ankyrin repeat domain-containing protein [Fibrobacteria bacterium]